MNLFETNGYETRNRSNFMLLQQLYSVQACIYYIQIALYNINPAM